MKWLEELARRRQASRSDQERRRHDRIKALEAAKRETRGFVIPLLKDIGKAYWGSVRRPFQVRSSGDYGWSVSSRATSEGYHRWTVDLHYSEGSHCVFIVYGKDVSFETTDISRAALEAALQSAVAAGPRYWWVGG
jgi:hypothetical protein